MLLTFAVLPKLRVSLFLKFNSNFFFLFFLNTRNVTLWGEVVSDIRKWWELLKYGETWTSIHIFISVRPTWEIKYRCNCSLDVSQVGNITFCSLLYTLEKSLWFFLFFGWMWAKKKNNKKKTNEKNNNNSFSYTDLLFSPCHVISNTMMEGALFSSHQD